MDSKKDDKLVDILKSLALDVLGGDSLDSKVAELNDIYGDEHEDNGYRHSYSNIFSTIASINQKSEMGTIEVLSTNLYTLAKHRDIKNPKRVEKLYDHVNLEIAQINYMSDMKNGLVSDISQIKQKNEEFKQASSQLKEKLDSYDDTSKELSQKVESYNKTSMELEGKINGISRDYIAILGIFAAIILAFTGGISFTKGFLSLQEVPSFYVIRVFSVTFILWILSIWMLLTFISKIIDKPFERYWRVLVVAESVPLVLFASTFFF